MRPGEVEGKDYYFVSKEQFEEWIAGGQLLEHARVYGEYKGIPRGQVDAALQRGADVVLRIDVQVGWDHLNCGTELFTRRRRFLDWMGVHEEATGAAAYTSSGVQWIAGGQLLELALVYGEYKGIPRGQVDAALQQGAYVVSRIDVQVC